MNLLNIPAINTIDDMQTILHDITNINNINQAFNNLITDYIAAKIFQLKIKNAQFEMKWGLTFSEYEKESAQWENGASYEMEQEYYTWSEIITELQHYNQLQKKWN